MILKFEERMRSEGVSFHGVKCETDVKAHLVWGGKQMQVGNITINGKVCLAPMAGVCDLPFRLLYKEQGADLIYTEMVSAKGIYYKNKNTASLLATREEERPVALQLFGADPEIISEMAAQIEELPFDILQGTRVPNLYAAGRCVSVTDAMWDLTRVIPACAVTGEAAGLAAAMHARDGAAPDIAALQKSLVQAGVVLHKTP